MHSHVDYRWYKTFLNRVIKILICFCLVYTPFFANAGAAEKWEYDVIPDQSQTLKIKGHKVDQYGAAVNDYDYNTKIDPKTAANRTKMGNVGMGRLLKISGWGLLGSAALQSLLEAVDWVIDPEAQSIWRNKPSGGGSVSCQHYLVSGDGKGIALFLSSGDSTPFYSRCPFEAAKHYAENFSTGDGRFLRWIDEKAFANLRAGVTVQFEFIKIDSKGNKTTYTRQINVLKDPDQTVTNPPVKEYLTPEELADYANHTHPDYSNPELAPKLAPKYSPEIQTDLWKPSNPWEDANSPTVQEVKKELEKAPPEPKKEPEIKPNPETGGFALPAFCSWASSVCEFINWVKDNPDNENEEPEIPKEIDIDKLDTGTFKATPGCPQSIQVPVNLGGSGSVSISYEPICAFASKWSFVAPLIGFLSGAMIIVGVGRKGEDGEL